MEMAQAIYTVRNDVEADNLISEIRELEADRNRFEMIYKAKIEQIKADYERQTQSINNQIEFNKGMLQAYFNTVPTKNTKTQRTYKLLSGKLVMKLPTTKIAHDDAKILEYLQSEGNEDYTKKVPKLDWTKLKEDLEIKGDMIINKATGELIDIEGLKVEHTGEQFEIKL